MFNNTRLSFFIIKLCLILCKLFFFQVRKNFFPPRPRRKNKKPRQNHPRKRKSDSIESVCNMGKLRKQDDMSNVTDARSSTVGPSSSRTSYNVSEQCSSYGTKREQCLQPGTHSESDSLSSSQETIVICSKSVSSSQETVVPYDYLQQNKNSNEELSQKMVMNSSEGVTITLSIQEKTKSVVYNVDEEKIDKSKLENQGILSCSEVSNLSTGTAIARSESQLCESKTTDQGICKLSSEGGNTICGKLEVNKEARKSGGESSQNIENVSSHETASTSCCECGNINKVCDCGETSHNTTILSQESAIMSQESVTLSQGSITSGIGTSSFGASSQGVSDNSICSTCMVNPKNGAFVHGKSAHIYCCYKCSLKVWMQTGRCPICNAKVRQVLKAVVV